MAHRRAVRRRQLRTGRRWNERDPDRPGQDNHRRNRRRHLQWLPGAHRPRGPRAATQKSLPGPVPVTRDAPCARPKSGLRPTPSPSLPRTSNPSSRRAGGFSRHVAARWSGDAAKGSPSVIGMRPPPGGPGRIRSATPAGIFQPRAAWWSGDAAKGSPSVWSLSAAWSPPGEARRTGPVSFREANQTLPGRICHGAPQPGHWIRFGSLPHGAPGEARRTGPAFREANQSGPCARPLDFDLEPLCRMIGAGRGPSDRANFIQRGESERAVWCLPGGADLPWCAAAGAQLPGHWIRFGASLPHGRQRPVGPGQFHSERRIRAGRVAPSRAVRICQCAPQQGRNCPGRFFKWSLSVAWSPLLSTGPIAGQQQRLRTGIEPPR